MKYRAVLIVFLLLSSGIHSQNILQQGGYVFSKATEAEKIYLQLTGNTYTTIDVVWFKATVTNALFNTPTTISTVLHVELIDPFDKSIMESKLLKITNGKADSFFQLDSNFREGKYIIRAYTEWNKNFGDDFIFSIPITIYKFQQKAEEQHPIQDVIFSKDSVNDIYKLSAKILTKKLDSLNKGNSMLYVNWKGGGDSIQVKSKKNRETVIEFNVPSNVQVFNYILKTQHKTFSKSIVLDKEYGTLQFFPEGGSLVNGLESIVGFKFLNYAGKGMKISGSIIDEKENKVIDFKSNSLGMGKTVLTPQQGSSYFGVVVTKYGNTLKFKLPDAKNSGTVLRVQHSITRHTLRVESSTKSTDSIFIKAFHRGSNLFLVKSTLKSGKFSYALKKAELPNGVIGLTVYDSNYAPICERQFFNHLPNENLQIALKTDKTRYETRDRVSLSIKANKNGAPTIASVSVMAIDSSYFRDTYLNRANIVSYFLLASDIRGRIENPSFYFESRENIKHLDDLMLTQGWTNYKYDRPQGLNLFQAEKSLVVTGTVGGLQNMKKIKKKDRDNTYALNMMLFGSPLQIYTQEIKSNGFFNFELDESYGNGQKFVIQPSDDRNRSDRFKVNIEQKKSPPIAIETEQLIVPVDSIIEKRVLQDIKEKIRQDPFLLPNTIALNEVVVSDYLLTPERAKMSELHGLPDVVIDNKELLKKKKNWTGSLYSWLLFNYPQELRIDRVGIGGVTQVARVHGADFTYIVIDGQPVRRFFYDIIPDIPVRAIKSVEILRNTGTANRYFTEVFNCAGCSPPPFPAILAIYTYSGKGLFWAFPKKNNLVNATAPQYSPKREFYAPRYDKESERDNSVPDFRTLLHWQPNIVTDSNGESNITFYTDDSSGKKLLICEGITDDGRVGYADITYEVVE